MNDDYHSPTCRRIAQSPLYDGQPIEQLLERGERKDFIRKTRDSSDDEDCEECLRERRGGRVRPSNRSYNDSSSRRHRRRRGSRRESTTPPSENKGSSSRKRGTVEPKQFKTSAATKPHTPNKQGSHGDNSLQPATLPPYMDKAKPSPHPTVRSRGGTRRSRGGSTNDPNYPSGGSRYGGGGTRYGHNYPNTYPRVESSAGESSTREGSSQSLDLDCMSSSAAWDAHPQLMRVVRTEQKECPDYIQAANIKFRDAPISPFAIYYYDQTAPNKVLLANDVDKMPKKKEQDKQQVVKGECYDDQTGEVTGRDAELEEELRSEFYVQSYYTESAFTTVSGSPELPKPKTKSQGASRPCCGIKRSISVSTLPTQRSLATSSAPRSRDSVKGQTYLEQAYRAAAGRSRYAHVRHTNYVEHTPVGTLAKKYRHPAYVAVAEKEKERHERLQERSPVYPTVHDTSPCELEDSRGVVVRNKPRGEVTHSNRRRSSVPSGRSRQHDDDDDEAPHYDHAHHQGRRRKHRDHRKGDDGGIDDEEQFVNTRRGRRARRVHRDDSEERHGGSSPRKQQRRTRGSDRQSDDERPTHRKSRRRAAPRDGIDENTDDMEATHPKPSSGRKTIRALRSSRSPRVRANKRLCPRCKRDVSRDPLAGGAAGLGQQCPCGEPPTMPSANQRAFYQYKRDARRSSSSSFDPSLDMKSYDLRTPGGITAGYRDGDSDTYSDETPTPVFTDPNIDEKDKNLGYYLRKYFFDAKKMKVPPRGSQNKMLPQYSVSYTNYPYITFDTVVPEKNKHFYRTRKPPTFLLP